MESALEITLDLQSLAIIFIALGLGSFAKGMTGLGLPIFAIPVMSAALGVEHAVAIMVIPSLLSNAWLVIIHRKYLPLLRRLWPFLLAGILGGVLGSWSLAIIPPNILILLLIIWLGAYLILQYTHPEFGISDKTNKWVGPAIGLASGATQGATGISAPLIAPYIQSLKLEPLEYVFAVTFAFAAFSVSQLVALTEFDILTPARLYESLLALVPVMICLPLGVRASGVISKKTFDRALIAIFILMEAGLLYKLFF